MTERIDSVVIGAGVVGLAVAVALQRAGHETVLLEKAGAIGTGISARSSEVLHAGLYYPPTSLKSRLCIAGQGQLYDWCKGHQVPYRRIGKLVVATHTEQVAVLKRLQQNALAAGVHDLQWLSAAAARAMEPALHCVAALYSPSTGVVGSSALLLSLLGEFEHLGGLLALHAPVLKGQATPQGILLEAGDAASTRLMARQVVNATGLAAQQIALSIEGVRPASVPARKLLKGSYFALAGKSPFAHLIYPLPQPRGLGIHLTLDLAGQARFGPDAEAVTTLDYSVDRARAESFATAIRRYWPALPDGALVPAYAGIRPQLARQAGARDFVIHGRRAHGVAGLINLYGIESPGLTSALALADEVLRHLAD